MRKRCIICTPNKFHIIYMHAKTAYYMHAKQISYHIYACKNCILYAHQTNFISYICLQKLHIICTSNKFHIIYMLAKTAYYMHIKQISYHIYACKNCILYAHQTNFISYICLQKLHIICTSNKFHIIYMLAKTAYYMHIKQISYHIYACKNCVLYAHQTIIISYMHACMSIPQVFVFIWRTIYTHFHDVCQVLLSCS